MAATGTLTKLTFNDPEKRPFENIVGEEENVVKQRYFYSSPFSILFSAPLKAEIIIWATFNLSSAKVFNLEKSKILSFGKFKC